MQYTRDVQKHVEGLIREAKYREALAVYWQAFQGAEPEGRACYGMGYCHYKLGNYAECREALDKAVAKGYPAASELLKKLNVKINDKIGPAVPNARRAPRPSDDDDDFEQALKAPPPPLVMAPLVAAEIPETTTVTAFDWDMGFRYAGLAVAAAILLASGLPFFSVPFLSEEGDSLVRAAYAGLERSPLSALLAMVPFGLAAGTGIAASIIRSRWARGMILLALATTAISLAVVLIVTAFLYPSPSLGSLRAMFSNLATLRSGVLLMAVCLLGVYGLGTMSLFSLPRGIVACVSALGIPIVLGLCVWAYCSASVQIKASIALSARAGEAQAQSQEVAIEVTNEGTVPIYIETETRQALSPGQFALDVQKKAVETNNAAGEWLKGDVTFAQAEQNGKATSKIAPKGTLRFTGRLTGGEAARNVLLRAVLSGQGDTKIVSNEAQVVLPPPQPLPLSLSSPSLPGTEEAHRKLERLQEQLARGKAAASLASVRETREAIEKIESSSERESLNRAIDTAIFSAKERDAAEVMRRAAEAFKNESNEGYDRASSFAQEALDIFAKEPLAPTAVATPTAIALYAEAGKLAENAARAGDPVARFTLTGIMQLSNGRAGAFMTDNITGEALRVSEGDHLLQWIVEGISTRTVTLRKGAQTWELHKKKG